MFTHDSASTNREIAVPREVEEVVDNGIASYAVVVISDSLAPEDVRQVDRRVRQSSPQTKVLLIEGPDSQYVDPSLYDTSLDSWSGPIALISAVHRLVSG
ncbi:MAG: hypothetical protein WA700_09000 [Acidobacteriaceae bacterium]